MLRYIFNHFSSSIYSYIKYQNLLPTNLTLILDQISAEIFSSPSGTLRTQTPGTSSPGPATVKPMSTMVTASSNQTGETPLTGQSSSPIQRSISSTHGVIASSQLETHRQTTIQPPTQPVPIR